MSGTILLTGPNGGIGVGFVTQFLKSPYATTHAAIYAVRDPAKALALKTSLKQAPEGHKYEILPVNLESLASTRAFAADVNSRIASGSFPPISALILNAGVQDMVGENFTKDGLERTFQVNYLANFLLTLLLLKSMDKQHGRIIYVGSTSADPNWKANASSFTIEGQKTTRITTVEKMSRGIEEFPDNDVMKTGQRKYGLSKLLLGTWMFEIQRRLDADVQLKNISVLCHDPGWIGGTSITRNSPSMVKAILFICWIIGHVNSLWASNSLIRTNTRNGDDLLRVCFDREAFGEYPKALYIDGKVLYHAPKEAQDVEVQKRLWKESLVCAGVKEDDTVLEKWE